MDVVYFLKERTAFIRSYYATASGVFSELKRKIRDQEAPFDDPPYTQDGEPAFFAEWLNADTGEDIVGLSCLSLLSDTLKMYFETLKSDSIGFKFPPGVEKQLLKSGFVHAYKTALGDIFGTDWSDCAVDWTILEQVVLARNRSQHGENFFSFRVDHDDYMRGRRPSPFFVRDEERAAWEADDALSNSMINTEIVVTPTSLEEAVSQVEALADWIKENSHRATAWRRRQEP